VNEWLSSITPGQVLKWGGVVFAYAIGILIVISIVLAMFGVYE
jgi:hypothetical protein